MIELICVLAIASIIGGVVAGFSGTLLKSRGVASGLSQLSDLVEQSRQAAMAQDTYVWLGFAQASVDGSNRVIVIPLAGRSGQASDLANGITRPLTKPQLLTGISLESTAYLTLSGVDSVNNIDLSQSTYTFTQNVTGIGPVNFSALEFKPDGEIALGVPNKRYAGIGLVGSPAAPAGHDSCGIQVSLLTGRVAVYRR